MTDTNGNSVSFESGCADRSVANVVQMDEMKASFAIKLMHKKSKLILSK